MRHRILFINGHLNAGGVERSLVDVLRHFDYSRYEVDLLLLQGAGDYASEIPEQVHPYIYDVTPTYGPLVSTLWTSIRRGSLFLFLYRLGVLLGNPYRVLKWFCRPLHKHYDTVIAYRTGMVNRLAMFYVDADRRISWWHHGEMNVFGREKETLREEYRKCDAIVSVSDACSDMLRQDFPDSAAKVITIPNMLCADDIRQKSLNTLTPNQSTLTFHIVTVGRLAPVKNMPFCLEVAAKLKSMEIQFHWTIIGDGSEYQKLLARSKALNLSDCVTFTGLLANPYPYVAHADLYFHPSRVESQGLTILEAMALDTPVIAVASSGPKGFMKSGVNGELINSDEDEAVSAIQRLMTNEILRKDYVQAAQEAVKRFAPTTIISQIENVIQ